MTQSAEKDAPPPRCTCRTDGPQDCARARAARVFPPAKRGNPS